VTVPALPTDWSTQQLAEFLAAVSTACDPAQAGQRGVERAAEAFEAEIGFLVSDGDVVASVGFPAGEVPLDLLLGLPGDAEVELDGLGGCRTMAAHIEARAGRLVVARSGDEPFGIEQQNLLRGMARVLDLTVGMLERQILLERLSKIQRSISHRAPLQEVLDAITTGAVELLGADLSGLRVVDPDDPTQMIVVSSAGVPDHILDQVRRQTVGEGAGGRAIAQDRLIVVSDYARDPRATKPFAEEKLQAAMAAPVHEDGVAVGSLVVGSYRANRVFSDSEQSALLALAEHASLALTDARTVEEMREAQRSRDMFLAMVSHELKTPLTVIMGVLKTLELRGGELAAELSQELIGSGYERGRELEMLIDKLLRGARAELAGTVEPAYLPRLVRSALRGFDRTRTVSVAAIPDLTLHVDRGAVTQVIEALVENAVSHSPMASEIRIRTGYEDGVVTIDVDNEGDLPPDVSINDLFAPFRRGSGTRTPGVGLGLYIASRVAETMEGSIDVRSGAGRVVFSLRFPASVAAPAAESSRAG